MKSGITRSGPVTAKMRRTAAPAMASSTWPPPARARLRAPASTCSPAGSQNRVAVMPAANVPCPSAAARSTAARSPAALVTSICPGAVTTGTPGGPDREPGIRHRRHPPSRAAGAACPGRFHLAGEPRVARRGGDEFVHLALARACDPAGFGGCFGVPPGRGGDPGGAAVLRAWPAGPWRRRAATSPAYRALATTRLAAVTAMISFSLACSGAAHGRERAGAGQALRGDPSRGLLIR